jgi:hypothetical protein
VCIDIPRTDLAAEQPVHRRGVYQYEQPGAPAHEGQRPAVPTLGDVRAECTFVYSRFLIDTMSIERKAGGVMCGVMYCMIWKNLYNVFLVA